jgi:carbon monoxide dehydrogenase subunit G
MKLDNVFTVGVPITQAWEVLTDLELIAPCMPGAVLTGASDDVYTGKVKIKVGPVTAEYSGTAQFTEKDPASYRAVIDARGRDSRGNGNANAVISAQLLADGDSTTVTVTTDLTIAGRIAQFGSGMIKEVSAKLLGQFVTCLESKLGGDLPAQADAGAAANREPAADSVAAAENTAAEKADASADVPSSPLAVPAAVSGVAAEPAPIDLMSVAGGAISKRLIPAVIGLVLVATVIYLIVRWL